MQGFHYHMIQSCLTSLSILFSYLPSLPRTRILSYTYSCAFRPTFLGNGSASWRQAHRQPGCYALPVFTHRAFSRFHCSSPSWIRYVPGPIQVKYVVRRDLSGSRFNTKFDSIIQSFCCTLGRRPAKMHCWVARSRQELSRIERRKSSHAASETKRPSML